MGTPNLELSNQIKRAIADGDIEKALDFFASTYLSDDALIIRSNYNDYLQNQIEGTEDKKEYRKIKKRILLLANQLAKGENGKEGRKKGNESIAQASSHPSPQNKVPIPKALTLLPLANQGTDTQSYFVGREKELKSIQKLLSDNKTVLLLNGIGGIGKTTLARQYMTEQHEDYDQIAWISVVGDGEGEGYQTAAQAFANEKNLFKSLGIPFDPKAGEMDRRKEILTALRSLEGNNLLIIDNAGSSVEDIKSELPTPPSWQVLITSRQQLNGFTIKKVDELSPEEAKKLFLLHHPAGKDQLEDIEALCVYIGYHTLTIELFAKCCQTHSLSVSPARILALLKEKELIKLSKKVWTDHSDREVEVYSYLLAAFHLGDLSEQEKGLLAQWAILPSEGIPGDLLLQLFNVSEDALDSFEENVTSLIKTGWITKTEGSQTYKMHQLIQETIRYQLPVKDHDITIVIDGAADVLHVDYTKDNPVDKFPLVIYGEFVLTHVPSDQTKISRLQNNLALRYKDLGRYEAAAHLLEVALESDLAHFGEAYPSVAIRRSNLATVYKALGRYESAASLLEAALESDLAHFGEAHPSVAKRRSNLANVYRDLGRYEEAAHLLEVAMESNLAHFGEAHPAVSVIRSNLALVYRDLGRYESAASLLEAALALDLGHFGESHPEIAIKRSNLALVYQDLGRYESAAKLLEAALASDLAHFGESNPTVARRRSNLATVYGDLGRYESAASLLEAALASDLGHFGESHPEVAIKRSNLALAYQDLGRYEEAAHLLEAALASDVAHFGEAHPSVARSRSNLASAYLKLGRQEEARTLFESAYAIFLKVLGAEHPHTLTVKEWLDGME